MEENLKIPYNSPQKCKSIDDETRKVKEFVYKHLRDMTGGSFFNSEGSSTNGLGGSIKKEKLSLNKTHCKIQQGAVFSGKILSFECSVCKDSTTYSPNDLLKHFRAVHKETLPTYPCDLCCFVTHEFPALQRHRIEHRNTLVTCELCSDGVQYSLLLLTRHYIMCHSQNGQFNCDWCEFVTLDAGTFVQHIHHHNESPWKCSKCRHISLNESDYKKHVKAHLGSFPFTCEVCGYGATTSEYLTKHLTAVHKDKARRMNGWNDTEDSSAHVAASASGDDLLNIDSQDVQRISRLNHVTGSLSNPNFRLNTSESLEETCHLMDSAIANRESKMWTKSSHSTDLTVLQDCDVSAGFDVSGKCSSNGLTVLMVRNKISLPPNCTTKVVGFKVVDGKKHLVLKVIPTEKQVSYAQNQPSPESVCSSAAPQVDYTKVLHENGECAGSTDSILHSYVVSPKPTSFMHANPDEIVAVKVKIEEEETSVCSLDTCLQTDVGIDASPSPHQSCLDASCSSSDNYDHVGLQIKESTHFDSSMLSPTVYSGGIGESGLNISSSSNLSSRLVVAQQTLSSEQVSKNKVENCRAAAELPVTDAAEQINDFHCDSLNNIESNYEHTLGRGKPDRIQIEIEHKNEHDLVGRNSQSQEVFTFHNYFKEQLNPSPSTAANCSSTDKDSARKERNGGLMRCSMAEPLETPPQRLAEEAQFQDQQDFDQVPDSDDIFDRCAVEDSSGEDGCLESIFQDFNIIKVEEDIVPISPEQSEAKNYSTSLDSFDKNHTDGVLSQPQLTNTGKAQPRSRSNELLEQTIESPQMFKSNESKQPILLSTSENKCATPLQVKAHSGFKLITSSTPQINVSYFRPSQEKSCNQGGANVKPVSGRLHVAAQKAVAEKRTALSVQPGDRATSNHFLINHLGLKNPVILSQSLHSTSTKKNKTQPTCYLLQRPLSSNENSSTSGLKLAGTQLQLNSRPVLAMSVSSANKLGTLQPGQQAFLLRYISPTKSGLLSNNQDGKLQAHGSETSEGVGSKVIFKIVTPTSSLTSGTCTSNTHPSFMPASPPTQCFLVSSNKNPADTCSGMKKIITLQSTTSRINANATQHDRAEPALAPRPIRPPSQRKRRRKQLFDELPELVHKTRKLSKKTETTIYWKPVSKEVERTLRLAPFSCLQQVRCPRRNQPVVVLNHPDADIPEVANIMKVVHRHRGAVTKVVLSQKTLQALSEMSSPGDRPRSFTKGILSHRDRPRPVQSSVREQFLLRLKLRKKSRKKYEVVKSLPSSTQASSVFDCWFCGRLFYSQEDWIGHGQRHLMEATRDWNKLFQRFLPC